MIYGYTHTVCPYLQMCIATLGALCFVFFAISVLVSMAMMLCRCENAKKNNNYTVCSTEVVLCQHCSLVGGWNVQLYSLLPSPPVSKFKELCRPG